MLRLLKRFLSNYADFDVAVVTKTGDYTITVNDHVVLVDASGGNVIITLPAIGDVPDEKIYHVKKVDSSGNIVTVTQGG